MDAASLVARFGRVYLPVLALSIAALPAAGSHPSTGSNLLVFLGCLFWATGPLKANPHLLAARGAFFKALAGIIAIDVLAQAAFIGYVFVQKDSNMELWRSLPFVFTTVVVVQGLLAYDMLKRRLRASASA